ncbi:MAG: hypothetical protein ACI9JN_002736 [Bacteroidia bacterium]|jgi:uncharacterized protein YbjT (DUF2867 family)
MMILYIRYMHVLIVGSTGAIGKLLLQLLIDCEQVIQITTINRRITKVKHEKLTEVVTDFNKLSELDIGHTDVAFCCLGSTIKKAGSNSAFERVDLDFVVDFAKLSKRLIAAQFHVVSAAGASKSSLFFYNRVKGHMEEAIRQVGIKQTYVYRPSLLDSERTEKRKGERLAINLFRVLNAILVGPLRKYASIKTSKVAQGMLNNALNPQDGFHIIESDQI